MKHDGFTLIEVAVAIAIAGPVICASLAAVSRTWRSQAANRPSGPQQALAQIQARLSEDFVHATSCKVMKDAIEFQTIHRLDGKTLRAEHLPCIVTYRVSQIEGRNCLVRTQTDENNTRGWSELLSGRARSLGIEGFSGPGPAPQRLKVNLTLDGQETHMELVKDKRW